METNNIDQILDKFQPIQLEEMDEVSLMKRVDQKFTIPYSKLITMLPKLTKEYRCLEIDEKRLFSYQTEYLDTNDQQMFLRHHNERVNRYKIRFRDYIESNLSFLEIKFKNNKSETLKKRIQVDFGSRSIDKVEKKFISKNSTFKAGKIEAKLANSFKRVTLVNLLNKERVTIDFQLQFKTKTENIDLPELAIIELKKEKNNLKSTIISLLKENKIRPTNFSKYAIGSVLTSSNLKYNKLKKKLIYLNKIHPHGNIWNRAV